MDEINSPAFGIDMDPSHIHRAGENSVEAIAAVISRVKHVHIRDCKGRDQNPGKPEMQANGRGDIDLVGYIRVLHENGYTGPINLEIIGAKDYDIERCCIIAAESLGIHAGLLTRHAVHDRHRSEYSEGRFSAMYSSLMRSINGSMLSHSANSSLKLQVFQVPRKRAASNACIEYPKPTLCQQTLPCG